MAQLYIPEAARLTQQDVVAQINHLVKSAIGDKYDVIAFTVSDVSYEQCQAFVDCRYTHVMSNQVWTYETLYQSLKHTFPSVKARITIV